jgi:acyl carrier protein
MSNNASEIESLLKKFIAENLLFSEKGFQYGNDVSFLAEGIIDSIGVMELVSYVGATFNITIDPQEVTPENFDSVSKLVSYIQRKRSVALV